MADPMVICKERFRKLIHRFPKRQRALASAFWVEALMRASTHDGEKGIGRGIYTLNRGQFWRSRRELAGELGCSERQCRTLWRKFEELGELAGESSRRGTVATILNYEAYVDGNRQTVPQNDPQAAGRPEVNSPEPCPTAGQAAHPTTRYGAVEPLVNDKSYAEDAGEGGPGNDPQAAHRTTGNRPANGPHNPLQDSELCGSNSESDPQTTHPVTRTGPHPGPPGTAARTGTGTGFKAFKALKDFPPPTPHDHHPYHVADLMGQPEETRAGGCEDDEDRSRSFFDPDVPHPNRRPRPGAVSAETSALAVRIEQELSLNPCVTGVHLRHLEQVRQTLTDEEIVLIVAQTARYIRAASNPWTYMVGLRTLTGVLANAASSPERYLKEESQHDYLDYREPKTDRPFDPRFIYDPGS